MLILVINSGSSSIKYQIFDINDADCRLFGKGMVDRIGSENSKITHQVTGREKVTLRVKVLDHEDAINNVFEFFTENPPGGREEVVQIEAVGHRVVHGGELFKEPVLINKEVKKAIADFARYAPLHNPANLDGIYSCERRLPDVPQVAVFDTAFHSQMAPEAYLYGIPLSYYESDAIRKYGFHGSSHQFVSEEAMKILQERGRTDEPFKIITCHLGNGSSIAAVKGGRSVDTSMGYTPLDGLIMGTRCGSIDPAVVLHLAQYWGLARLDEILNKESGFMGLTGFSDFRDLLAIYEDRWEEAGESGGDLLSELGSEERAGLKGKVETALFMFVRQIKKHIGAYAAVLEGVDAVVFTAGIGENSPQVREWALTGMEWMGISIDPAANRRNSTVISSPESETLALVVPTNEELVIARETYRIVA